MIHASLVAAPSGRPFCRFCVGAEQTLPALASSATCGRPRLPLPAPSGEPVPQPRLPRRSSAPRPPLSPPTAARPPAARRLLGPGWARLRAEGPRPCPALPGPAGHGGHPEPAAVVPAAMRGLPRCQHHQHDHLVPRRPRLLRHPAPTPPRPHVSTVPGIEGRAGAAGSAGLGHPLTVWDPRWAGDILLSIEVCMGWDHPAVH